MQEMETRLNSQQNQEGITELYSILGTLQAEHQNIKSRISQLDESKKSNELQQDIHEGNQEAEKDDESDCISRD